jgi:hypothetical protein
MLAPAQAGFLRLKSYVHAFAHVPRHRHCWLKEITVDFLNRARPNVVQNLPGYIAPRRPAGPPSRSCRYMVEEKHSEKLNRLFDHSVFQRFQFLQLGTPAQIGVARSRAGAALEPT